MSRIDYLEGCFKGELVRLKVAKGYLCVFHLHPEARDYKMGNFSERTRVSLVRRLIKESDDELVPWLVYRDQPEWGIPEAELKKLAKANGDQLTYTGKQVVVKATFANEVFEKGRYIDW